MAVQRGRSERRGGGVRFGTLTYLRDARTKLAGFFSILLQHRELRLRPRVALGGSFLVPFPCRRIVLRHTPSVGIQLPELSLRPRVALAAAFSYHPRAVA